METKTDIRPRGRIERVIWEFGGATKLAALLGVHVSAVHQWKQNDRIPAKRQSAILKLAQARGLKIDATDLIGG